MNLSVQKATWTADKFAGLVNKCSKIKNIVLIYGKP